MKVKLLFLIILGGLFFSSCDDDSNKHTSLLGSWNCEEFPEQTYPRNYQVNITRNPYIANVTNEYIINNFYNLGNNQNTEVYFHQDEETGELILRDQVVNNIAITGRGTVSTDFSLIKWEYYISSGVIEEKVLANYY